MSGPMPGSTTPGGPMSGGDVLEPHLAITFGPMEIGIVFAILILFFGAKKLPLLARGLGTGIRNFKGALTAPQDDAEPEITEVEHGPK